MAVEALTALWKLGTLSVRGCRRKRRRRAALHMRRKLAESFEGRYGREERLHGFKPSQGKPASTVQSPQPQTENIAHSSGLHLCCALRALRMGCVRSPCQCAPGALGRWGRGREHAMTFQ